MHQSLAETNILGGEIHQLSLLEGGYSSFVVGIPGLLHTSRKNAVMSRHDSKLLL